MKTLYPEAEMSFPGWQYFMHNVTNLPRKRNMEALCLELKILPYMTIPLADFNLYTFPVINCNPSILAFRELS